MVLFRSLVAILVFGLASQLQAQNDEEIVIHDGVSEEAQRLIVSLTASAQQSHGGGGQQINSEPVPDPLAKKFADREFTHFFDLGAGPDKSKYAVLAKEADLKTLTDHSNWREVVVLRQNSNGETATMAEGLIGPGSVQVPFRSEIKPIGTNGLREAKGEISFSIHGYSGNRWMGTGEVGYNLQLQGEALTESAEFKITFAPVKSLEISPDQNVSIQLQPFEKSLTPRIVQGRVGDVISFGPAKLVVEKFAPDLSAVTLAVIEGDLDDSYTQAAEKLEQIPAFAQVELIRRAVYSDDQILSGADWTVFVFGEFANPSTPSHFHHSGHGQGQNLSMSETALLDLLGRDLDARSSTVFVVRQLPVRMLYDDFLGKEPPFLVLSDMNDWQRVQFQAPGAQHHYPMPHTQAQPQHTLRGKMGLSDGTVSLVLADAQGKVHYVNSDASSDLRTKIIEINRIMRGESQTQQADQPEQVQASERVQ